MSESWPKADDEARSAAKAQRLKARASTGGLRFEAYLPPSLAVWLLEEIEKGAFLDPQEATLAAISEARDLSSHADLRRELFARIVREATSDAVSDPPMKDSAEIQNSCSGIPDPAVWISY